MAEQSRIARESMRVAAEQAKQQSLAARPPRVPIGPLPDISEGIASANTKRRRVFGSRRKRNSTRKHKRSHGRRSTKNKTRK